MAEWENKSETSHLIWYTHGWQQSSALNHSFYTKENRTRTCMWVNCAWVCSPWTQICFWSCFGSSSTESLLITVGPSIQHWSKSLLSLQMTGDHECTLFSIRFTQHQSFLYCAVYIVYLTTACTTGFAITFLDQNIMLIKYHWVQVSREGRLHTERVIVGVNDQRGS